MCHRHVRSPARCCGNGTVPRGPSQQPPGWRPRCGSGTYPPPGVNSAPSEPVAGSKNDGEPTGRGGWHRPVSIPGIRAASSSGPHTWYGIPAASNSGSTSRGASTQSSRATPEPDEPGRTVRVTMPEVIRPGLPPVPGLPGQGHALPGGVGEPDHRAGRPGRPHPRTGAAVQHRHREPGAGQVQGDAAADHPGAQHHRVRDLAHAARIGPTARPGKEQMSYPEACRCDDPP